MYHFRKRDSSMQDRMQHNSLQTSSERSRVVDGFISRSIRATGTYAHEGLHSDCSYTNCTGYSSTRNLLSCQPMGMPDPKCLSLVMHNFRFARHLSQAGWKCLNGDTIGGEVVGPGILQMVCQVCEGTFAGGNILQANMQAASGTH